MSSSKDSNFIRPPDTLSALWVTSAKLPAVRRRLVRACLLRDLGHYLHRENRRGFELHRLAVAEPEIENLSWEEANQLPMVAADAAPPILEVARTLVQNHPVYSAIFGAQIQRPDRVLDLWILVWASIARWQLWTLERELSTEAFGAGSPIDLRAAESALWPAAVALWSEPLVAERPIRLRQWWFADPETDPPTLWSPENARWSRIESPPAR